MPRLSKIGAACLAAFGYTQGTSTVTTNYLTVAGGGGGGYNGGGGGGAGGLILGIASLNFTQSYVVTVGAGGYGSAFIGDGSSGSNSSFSSFATATGGGKGGDIQANASNGGSGGGGGTGYANVAPGSGGTGVSGQGNAGGSGRTLTTSTPSLIAGGGGGGASATGGAGGNGFGGTGGTGTASSISGTSVTYAGGGAGGGGTSVTAGGVGGGGSGGGGSTAANNGGINSGGGGGGGGNPATTGGKGGAGVVIISYTSPTQLFGGGIVTFVGGNWIHTFTTSGTLVPVSTFTASYLVVAGGAGGGSSASTNPGGGGGAGGLTSGSILVDTNSNYIITVGAGGAGSTSGNVAGNNGGNSAFLSFGTTGGGGGGSNTGAAVSGGSGGGGTFTAQTGAAGTAGQGNAGGNGFNAAQYSAGGGGGSGAVGGAGSSLNGGNGGAGTSSSISGTATFYAGGGGGGTSSGATAGGTGGSGGGGNGGKAGAGTAGGTNTGGGGGGSGYSPAANGQAGGSGVVIISYAGAQRMAGGTVTFVGGNTIHTFTSSGYLSALKLVDRSLRFKSSTSSYLNRTQTTTTNSVKCTFSGWVKRGTLGTVQVVLGGYTGTDADTQLYFDTTDQLKFTSRITNTNGAPFEWAGQSAAVFRDPAAWYHIVVSVDTSIAQVTNNAYYNVYVNGVAQTFTTVSGASLVSAATVQNRNTCWNVSGYSNALGRNRANYFDGYMTEVNFVDGQALTPSSFGGYNSFGVWQPCQYLGSYGTNGFYLPFTNNASSTTIGYDFSPNQNNWTANGFTLTPTTSVLYDSMTDVPTLTSETAANYAVLNSLANGGTLSNANLTTTGGDRWSISSIGMTSGKFYAEVTITTVGTESSVGIANRSWATGEQPLVGNLNTGSWGYWNSGNKANNTNSAYGASYTTGDVIGIAFDADIGTLTFYKNGVSQGAAFTGLPSSTYFFAVEGRTSGTANNCSINFGQRPFTQTVPTGFVALNTFNM